MSSILWCSHIYKGLKRAWGVQSTSFLHVVETVQLSHCSSAAGKGRVAQRRLRRDGQNEILEQGPIPVLHPEAPGFEVCGLDWVYSNFLSHAFSQTKVLLSFRVLESQIRSLCFWPISSNTVRKKMGKDCQEEVGRAEPMGGTLIFSDIIVTTWLSDIFSIKHSCAIGMYEKTGPIFVTFNYVYSKFSDFGSSALRVDLLLSRSSYCCFSVLVLHLTLSCISVGDAPWLFCECSLMLSELRDLQED